MLVPLTLAMAGFGAAGLPLTVTAMSGLGTERAGLASGLLSSTRQVGAAVGLALLVSIATTWTARQDDPATEAALTAGFSVGFGAAAALLLIASVLARALPGREAAHPPD